MSDPLVSLLMTAYNREKYIGEAIQSALDSNFTDFELIIVDDGSKDRTVEIARSFEEKDKRVKVYLNERNLGDYSNRNKAAGYATGKYIKYLDADDMIYPWGLDIIVSCMERHPDAAYGLDSLAQDNLRLFPILLGPRETYFREYFEAPLFDKAPTSCIIRRSVFGSVGGFSGRQYVGDYELWHKLSLTYNVLLMPHGIVWSRIHDDQQLKNNRENSMVLFMYSVVSREYIGNSACPLNEKERRIVMQRIIRSQARSALRSLLIEKNNKAYREKMRLAALSPMSCLANAFRNAE
jgi:glycosyltransferase involved in cell wall biosynthesis